jgi:hypothetical protein
MRLSLIVASWIAAMLCTSSRILKALPNISLQLFVVCAAPGHILFLKQIAVSFDPDLPAKKQPPITGRLAGAVTISIICLAAITRSFCKPSVSLFTNNF